MRSNRHRNTRKDTEKVFRPIIDRTFPLAETAAAQQYIMDRKQFGKVVVVD
jgi:NADPH:quinone reductase-like Zn-dependent oxidoreductase